MFVELRFKTIDVNKKHHQTESFPYFCFRYHPVFLPFFRSPGTLYAPQVTFRPYLTGKGEEGGGGEAIPFNKSSQNNALKTCKAISRHCQRIVPLRSDEHFAFKEKPWCARELATVKRFFRWSFAYCPIVRANSKRQLENISTVADIHFQQLLTHWF